MPRTRRPRYSRDTDTDTAPTARRSTKQLKLSITFGDASFAAEGAVTVVDQFYRTFLSRLDAPTPAPAAETAA